VKRIIRTLSQKPPTTGRQAHDSIFGALARSLGFVSGPSALYLLESLPKGRPRHGEFCEVAT
jgi:hypothetical protein